MHTFYSIGLMTRNSNAKDWIDAGVTRVFRVRFQSMHVIESHAWLPDLNKPTKQVIMISQCSHVGERNKETQRPISLTQFIFRVLYMRSGFKQRVRECTAEHSWSRCVLHSITVSAPISPARCSNKSYVSFHETSFPSGCDQAWAFSFCYQEIPGEISISRALLFQ